jgi:predicted aspartyl protease
VFILNKIMKPLEPKTFTREYDGIARDLRTECGVCKAFDPASIQSGKKPPQIVEFDAIWDTGATDSVVSKRVVQTLGLKATSKVIVYHAGGGGDYVDAYSVNIFLPNETVFSIMKATEADLVGADVLIGMDIISVGDFAITASHGKTKFSFQIPSTHDIDFSKNA